MSNFSRGGPRNDGNKLRSDQAATLSDIISSIKRL